MPTLQVYDPAMCCSTGVCGPQVDPALVRFASDLAWLKKQGVTVGRYNLGQNPQEFLQSHAVTEALQNAPASLPILTVDGAIRLQGRYPSRTELAEIVGIEAPEAPQLLTVLNG